MGNGIIAEGVVSAKAQSHVGDGQEGVGHPKKDNVFESNQSQPSSSGTLPFFVTGGEGKFSS